MLDAPLTTRGRADAVYNRFVIEFEPPGSLRPSVLHSATQHAVGQVQQYLRGISSHASVPLERLAGCAFDGSWIVYVTWERDSWAIARPKPVDTETLAALLETLVSLATGRGLTATNLDDDFGRESESSRVVVSTLFGLFSSGAISERGRAMFDQWSLDLGNASGQFSASDLSEWESLCSGFGVPSDEESSGPVLFSTQTYFALVAKLVALIILEGSTGVRLVSDLMSFADAQAGFQFLESGDLTAATRTINGIEPGIFSWYATEPSPTLKDALAQMVSVASEYSAEIVEITPLIARDVLKDLYQRLIPRSIRHRLGEYYTPDWLAERVVNQVTGSAGPLDPRTRFLDPACGSGTFLVEVISRMVAATFDKDPGYALRLITKNVVGFDLSPLAVQAAKVNYLLALAPLLRSAGEPLFLPVFLADSVSPPKRGGLLEGDVFVLGTTEGEWRIPTVLAESNYLPAVGSLLREGVEVGKGSDWVTGELIERVPIIDEGDEETIQAVADVYGKLMELEEAERNGMWWHLVSNAFAPTLHGRFDYVLGNPPWVSWETLPEAYRRANDDQWIHYGLRPDVPLDRRQASANVRLDLSMLFVARCIDRYLVPEGRLGFLITASVFKSELAGRGFRHRRLPPDGKYRFNHIDDMSSLAVFEGAVNQTAVLIASRQDSQDETPILVERWTGPEGGRATIPTPFSLEQVIQKTSRRQLMAEPIDPYDQVSPLLIMPRPALVASRPLRRSSPYLEIIREGVNTRGANGVFFVEILEYEDGLLRIRNLASEGRNRRVTAITGLVEEAVVRHLLRGNDVSRGVARPSAGVLLFHDEDRMSTSIPPEEVRERFPMAFEYISQFEDVLRERRIFRNFDPTGDGWLGIYSVTSAALARHKVVVREIAQGMIAAPVHGSEVIPDHKLYVIPCKSSAEAALLARVLNSPIVDYMIRSYAVSTSISGSFLRYMGVQDLSELTLPPDEDLAMAMALGLTTDEYRILNDIARRELGTGPR